MYHYNRKEIQMRNIFLASCLLALFIFAGCSTAPQWAIAPGQHGESFEKVIPVKVHTNFLLYLPSDFGKEKKRWPLIMFLHGSGERGNDLQKVKMHGPPKFVEQQTDFPFIVVSPQAPAGGGWSPEVLNALLDEVIGQLPVDPDRMYLTGLSMGGYGTWALATEYPDRFAAIAPVCGAGDVDRVCALKNVPVWAFHGAKDNVVPLKGDQETVDALKKCGGEVSLTVYPDAGHDAWTQTYANPDLYAWFLKHRREAK
jgi:predicted peptidase